MSSVSSRGSFPSCGTSILGVLSDDIYQWMDEDQVVIALAAHDDIGFFLLWGDVMLSYGILFWFSCIWCIGTRYCLVFWRN